MGFRMSFRRTALFAGLGIIAIAGFVVTAAPQAETQKGGQKAVPGWVIKVNETRGPIRAADVKSPLGKEVTSEILGGPTNGSDGGYLMFTRIPPGARGPAMYTLSDNHYYVVLEGRMNVQIGTDKFVVERYQGVVIPAGIPLEISNADATTETRAFELIAPGASREIVSMMKPTQPRNVDNAAQYIRRPKIPELAELKPGLTLTNFSGRASGTEQQVRIDGTPPGSGGPPPHVHKFQQVYFQTEGTTTATYGLNKAPLPKYSVVIFPGGMVHTNFNDSNAPERHIVLMLNEPPDRSEPFDIGVQFTGAQGCNVVLPCNRTN